MKNAHQKQITLSPLTSTVICLIALTACQAPEAPKASGADANDEITFFEDEGAPNFDDQALLTSTGPGCYEDKFKQPSYGRAKTLDILFVTDTSGSLKDDKDEIADGLDRFVKELPKGLDYRIAVMVGHGSKGSHSGKLTKFKNNEYVLNSKKSSLSDIRKQLKSNFLNAPTDHYADGGEEELYSLNKVLTNKGMLQAAQAHGFFRKDAALAVIVITDENDICYPGKVKDYDGNEIPAYKRDCKDITATNVYKNLKALKGNLPLAVSGIVYSNSKTIPRILGNSEDELAFGILDFISVANGKPVDLGLGHFEEGLAVLGKLCSAKIDYLTEFKLTRTNVDPSSIQVFVDGYRTNFYYNSELNEVQLKDFSRLKPGVSVSIQYCEKTVTQPSPSATPSVEPSASPSATPSVEPSASPSATPSVEPSASPSATPSVEPSASPSATPSVEPSASPSVTPSVEPSASPSVTPSVEPSVTPTVTPTSTPSASPSAEPSATPTVTPSSTPSSTPSVEPSVTPSATPTTSPSPSPSPSPSTTVGPNPPIFGA